jgi:peptidoglycan DL-endopeptidase CwlO
MVGRSTARASALVALCVLVTMLAPVAAPAQQPADPQPGNGQPGNGQPPTTVAGLLSYFYDLSAEAEKVNEELLLVQEELNAARQTSITAGERAAKASKAAETARNRARTAREDANRVTALLSAADVGGFSALMNSSSEQDLLARMEAGALAAKVTGGATEAGDAAIAAAERAADDAAKAQEAARTAEETVAKGAEDVQRRQGELNKRITEVKATLARLTPDQRALLAEIEDPGSDVAIPPGDIGAIVRFALSQVGKPYVWGAVGPDSYDCSGLMQTAFRAAGVALPRVSIQQSGVGQQITRAEIRAGDLVFYYQPVHHVAMAVDNFRAVHAPSFGQNVKVQPIDSIGPITVIRRMVR